jgi:hypothetical protein
MVAHTQLLLTWLAQLALQVGGPVLRILQINSRKLALVWAKEKSSHCLSCWFGCLTVKVQAACFLSCIWQMGLSGFQVFMRGININPGFWVKVLPALCEIPIATQQDLRALPLKQSLVAISSRGRLYKNVISANCS